MRRKVRMTAGVPHHLRHPPFSTPTTFWSQIMTPKTFAPEHDAIDTLNTLIEVNQDANAGYMRASEGIPSAAFTQGLQRFAHQHEKYISELTNLVIGFSGEPASERPATGEMHHAWMNIDAAVGEGGHDGILTECERGETTAMLTYENALEQGLPDNAREIVVRQYDEISQVRGELQKMRQAASV
jgi:uncharacterized protein (TIGR02284 family)